MQFARYLKVLWLYAIGLAFVFYGLYSIMFSPPSAGPFGFGLMVAGLLFSTVGGFYGKHMLMAGAEVLPSESRHMDQIKQNVVSQLRPPEVRQEARDPPTEASASPAQIMQASNPDPQPQPQAKPSVAQPEPKAEPKPIIVAPAQLVQSQAQEQNVLKVMVCPGCNFENPPSNMFCSKCGKRLKAIEEPQPKKAKPHHSKKKAKGKR